jgi:hypothetical protein
MAESDEYLRFTESIQEQLNIRVARLSSDAEARNRLFQEEIDRRFSAVVREREMDISAVREKVDALSLRLDQRYEAQQIAINASLASAQTAVAKAEIANEKRFESVNEFRAQQGDLIRGFISRNEYQSSHNALEDKAETASNRNAERLADLDKRVTDQLSSLELRISSRLDLSQGNIQGATHADELTEAKVNQRLVLTGILVSVVVILAQIVIAALSHHL